MRILFVAMAHTVHTARWLAQLNTASFELHLFPVDHKPLHAEIAGTTVHSLLYGGERNDGVRRKGVRWPFRRGLSSAVQTLEGKVPRLSAAERLARLIRRLKPDLVHVLHMQHAGYLMLSTLQLLAERETPPIAYSSWGSDMYYYGKLAAHAPRIRAFLERCRYYFADCERDVVLAKEFGFRGETLGVFPVGGGYDIDRERRGMAPGPSSKRRVIALKGYQNDNWAGRALVGLHAISICRDLLADFQVAIFSATENTRYAAEFLARITQLDIRILPSLSHEEMLKLMGSARVSIGLSTTDGTPNAMLEAMIMGALPIQSDTVSTAEWIRDGENGLLVPPEDPNAVAVALRRAVSDDALIDAAACANERLVNQRLRRAEMAATVIELYRRLPVTAR
jgi:hypothetical protein